MRKIRSFSLIFADFCWFSLFLEITAFRGRRFSQFYFRRKPQETADFRRNPFVPFSLSLLVPPYWIPPFFITVEFKIIPYRVLLSAGSIHQVMWSFLAKLWPKNAKIYLSTWRPRTFKTSTLASRDVKIPSQICGSNLQKVFTLGDGCWLPILFLNYLPYFFARTGPVGEYLP